MVHLVYVQKGKNNIRRIHEKKEERQVLLILRTQKFVFQRMYNVTSLYFLINQRENFNSI